MQDNSDSWSVVCEWWTGRAVLTKGYVCTGIQGNFGWWWCTVHRLDCGWFGQLYTGAQTYQLHLKEVKTFLKEKHKKTKTKRGLWSSQTWVVPKAFPIIKEATLFHLVTEMQLLFKNNSQLFFLSIWTTHDPLFSLDFPEACKKAPSLQFRISMLTIKLLFPFFILNEKNNNNRI